MFEKDDKEKKSSGRRPGWGYSQAFCSWFVTVIHPTHEGGSEVFNTTLSKLYETLEKVQVLIIKIKNTKKSSAELWSAGVLRQREVVKPAETLLNKLWVTEVCSADEEKDGWKMGKGMKTI